MFCHMGLTNIEKLQILDLKNNYEPDLDDIKEAALRTKTQAECFFKIIDLSIKNTNLDVITNEMVYDISNSFATILAEACELYLKALYLLDRSMLDVSVKELWKELSSTKDKFDSEGNRVYDSTGKRERIKGHDLDNLIAIQTIETKLMVETRIMTIPIENTESHKKVTFIDVLKNKGVLFSSEVMTSSEYEGWLERHKRTFEEARYGGQKNHDFNLEFLYHLTSQIKAVSDYKFDIVRENDFVISDDEIKELPIELQKLFSFNEKFVTMRLVKLISQNTTKRDELIMIVNQDDLLQEFLELKSNTFYLFFENMSFDEINFIYLFIKYLKNLDFSNYKNEYTYLCSVSTEHLVSYCILLKSLGISKINLEAMSILEQTFGLSILDLNKDFNIDKYFIYGNGNYNFKKC